MSDNASSPSRKRRKAQRACDTCRRRKLRCEYGDELTGACGACQRSGTECISSEPAKIDKRRLRALVDLATTDAQKQLVANLVAERGVYIASTDSGALRKARPSAAGDPLQLISKLSSSRAPDKTLHASGSSGYSNEEAGPSTVSHEGLTIQVQSSLLCNPRRRGSGTRTSFKKDGLEPRMQGATASINLLGDLADSSDVARHDRRYGLFRLADEWVYGANPDEPMREVQLADQQIREDIIATLISSFTEKIAPVNSVIAPHRVSRLVKATPLILHSVLAVAALHRDVPPAIYTSIRQELKKRLMEHDGSGSTLPQVQSMLVSGMSHELLGETNMEGGSHCWLRVGIAIRQAQDLGLHRLIASHWVPEVYADRIRAWLGCIIADRWYAAAYGQPLAIDLLDCEDPFVDQDLLTTPDGSHQFQKELYKVSCLLGKIMQTVFRPNALSRCTDEVLESLLEEIDDTIAQIPGELAFSGNATSMQGGLLHLTIGCIEVLFFRLFVRTNPKVPAHLSFCPSRSRWQATVSRSRSAICWMASHGDMLLDCWLMVKYAMTYYHFTSERDAVSLRSLAVARDVMNRWALGHHQDRAIPSRAKIADIIDIFYKSALRLQASWGTVDGVGEGVAADGGEYGQEASTGHRSGVGNGGGGESTLEDWLADVFRQYEAPDAGFLFV